MNFSDKYWMEYSINISQRSSNSGLHVGAVLVSDSNKILCSAFEGEGNNNSWYSNLMTKIKKLKLSNADRIYITVNTLSSNNSFYLMKLLDKFCIKKIFFGLPDPLLTTYLKNDPIITFQNVYCYPDELQIKILKLNKYAYENSKQNIKYNYYYSKNRISNLILDILKLKGFLISLSELDANKNNNALALLISTKYHIEYLKAFDIVNATISKAFNIKYSKYNYLNDVRSLNPNWVKNFMLCCNTMSEKLLTTSRILNVGVGSGNEAKSLFSNCKNITFVDIANDGLNTIKEIFPTSTIINFGAENLSSISDNSYELYISLRIYNSSFFDIEKAILEANRVLKCNSLIIISIANGFLFSEQNSIISGLIIPNTEFVDIYRSINTIKLIYTKFIQLGFKNVKIFPTDTEIYISAITN